MALAVLSREPLGSLGNQFNGLPQLVPVFMDNMFQWNNFLLCFNQLFLTVGSFLIIEEERNLLTSIELLINYPSVKRYFPAAASPSTT